MPDRSAGVQQGRTWFVFLCDHEEYHGDYARALEMAEKFLAGGTNKEGVRAEPREGEQDNLMGQHNRPPPDHTIASVLRLTASRLRDPEHRWSVDPAVTLERLAERLEAPYSVDERAVSTVIQEGRDAGLSSVEISFNVLRLQSQGGWAGERLAEKLEKGREDG